MLTVYVVSDATGETAERVVRSALVQFEQPQVQIVRRGNVLTPDDVHKVVLEAAGTQAIVLHTLVTDGLRREMLEEARAYGVDSMDLMGPLLDRLAHHLRLSPQERPGLFMQLAERRAREIEAVEFAFRHDDGQHGEDLSLAEVVLVGVSRTMKTPTMLYLAYRGWFAANVPLVPEQPPPPALDRLPPERVFCLLMSPSRLLELRQARAAYLGIPEEPYASIDALRREMVYSQELAIQRGWQRVEVTGKSVEEVGQAILLLLPGGDKALRGPSR
jgi:regulator of PEP synthase PpsR (kinase-PPPase family)